MLRLPVPAPNPVEIPVVFYTGTFAQTPQQLSQTIVVWKVTELEATDVGVQDLKFCWQANGQEILALELLVKDE